MDRIGTEYLALAWSLEKHAEGIVDAYYGPPEPRKLAEERALAPRAIAEQLALLRDEVGGSDYPRRRKEYVDLQLRSLETLARKLAGDELSYGDEVRGCFDIEPRHTSEAVFETAIGELATLLPGSGSVAERREAWQKRFEVPVDVARQMVERIAPEVRRRTSAFVDLPAGEQVEFAMVDDKPWSGYNWYLGAARSRIEINTDLPIRANGLLSLVAHETYPGHHVEHALKEQHLFREQGWAEHAICLLAPEAVVSEGIAMLAAEIIFDGDAFAWAAEEVYPLGGIVGEPEREARLAAATRALRPLSANAALLLHEEGADPEEVVRYLMRYGLVTEREARQSLRFISTSWRAYVFTYHAGRDLLERWLRHGDRVERFRTLLVEQVYPSLIEEWIAEDELRRLD